MQQPNYKDGSIVNLMSSIGESLGWKSQYKNLKNFPSSELKNYKNIVLIIIDGLGYEYLIKHKKSFLYKNMKRKMTSVFLPTTSAANTVFSTGVPPQQHGYTAWFMLFKEIGIVSIPLRFMPRLKGKPFSEYKVNIEEVFNEKPFFDKIKTKSYKIVHKYIADSDFTKITTGRAKKLVYSPTLKSFFNQIKKATRTKKKKFIHAYWPKLDSIAHEKGINSKETEKHFHQLDKKFKAVFQGFRGKDTIFIITADHGLIDTPQNIRVKIEDHPKLKECLTLPLCGEGRCPFCYVHPSKTKQFEKYVKTKLKKYCTLHKSEDLVKKNYFGLGKPNPKLFDRIGDYILMAKKNYQIIDKISGQDYNPNIGHHGGISKQEMLVPLIVFKGS